MRVPEMREGMMKLKFKQGAGDLLVALQGANAGCNTMYILSLAEDRQTGGILF